MALGICEAAERDAGYVLGRPDRLPAELLGSLERYLDVLDTDEEEHRVVAALRGPSSSAASLRAADECNTIDRTTIISLRGRRRTRHPGASRARAFGGNPYFFLSRRPFREEHLRAYVVRQHRNGRKVADILSDAYVRRLGSERFCWKVIEDPSTIEALERNVREAFADPHF
jgi:hypothetical protein